MQYDLKSRRSTGCAYQNLCAVESTRCGSDMGGDKMHVTIRGSHGIIIPRWPDKSGPDGKPHHSSIRGTPYLNHACGLYCWAILRFETSRDTARAGKFAPAARETQSAPGRRGSKLAG